VLHSQLLNLPKEWTNKLKLKSHFAGKPLPVSSRLRQTFQLLFFCETSKFKNKTALFWNVGVNILHLKICLILMPSLALPWVWVCDVRQAMKYTITSCKANWQVLYLILTKINLIEFFRSLQRWQFSNYTCYHTNYTKFPNLFTTTVVKTANNYCKFTKHLRIVWTLSRGSFLFVFTISAASLIPSLRLLS